MESVNGYRLCAGSPCIDSGVEIGWNGGRDYFGNPAPSGKTTDRGAFEQPVSTGGPARIRAGVTRGAATGVAQ
jgi:hypothetical protein